MDVNHRQLCWAHLKRDFIQISERVGVSAQIGKSLLEQEKELFNLWHKFRNDQLTRSELKERVEPIKTEVLSILLEASQL
ncbi:IS66 family transposase, partial [Microcoleus sp. OTE_8_concoct_300]|uniref:IS66 family transposase n=1 Tax=Microcoleus sp. OTE_8_concoct_300 TaxID=2964710 RepID=UPI00403FB706